MRYLVLDLETGSKTSYKRKGNPFDPDNKIIAIGFKDQNCTNPGAWYLPEVPLVEQDCLNLFDIKDVQILVGHNIKYDLLYLWGYKSLQDWLTNGGRVFDTQIAEYLLSGQKHTYPALREIAVNKYGCKEREKKMEEYWSKGIDTSEIPKELVIEDVTNDVLDTEQVMLQQVKLLKKQGLYKLAMEMMESLLATTEMEANGLFIDRNVLTKNKNSLICQIEGLKEQLMDTIINYWR